MGDPYRPKPRTEPRVRRVGGGTRVDAMFARLERLGATPEMIDEARDAFDEHPPETRAELLRAFAAAPDSLLREQIEQHVAEQQSVEFKAYASDGAVVAPEPEPEPEPEPDPEPPASKPAKKKAAAAKRAPAKAKTKARG